MSSQKKLIVFVGGSSGIGFEAVKSLLSSTTGYHVVLGSRSPLTPERDTEIQYALQSSKSTFEVLDCDLASYASVRAFANAVKTRHTEPIDRLVLCAAIVPNAYRETVDGEHDIIQVNVLSHALLIDELAGNLSDTAHVVLVSSGLFLMQTPGVATPENLERDLKENWNHMQAYQRSKLLQVYLTFIAAERFTKEKPGVRALVLSPGFIPTTGLGREHSVRPSSYGHNVQPIETGAAVIMRCVEDDLPSGTYVATKGVEEVPDTYKDPKLLEEWRNWFVGKKVWEAGTA